MYPVEVSHVAKAFAQALLAGQSFTLGRYIGLVLHGAGS